MTATKVPLIKSTFFNEEETKEKLIDFIRSSSKLSMGVKCLEFESAFAAYQGRKHAVFFNSGSSANLALLQALLNLGLLQTGDTVGFSALTWSTNVMPIMQLGLKAVPVDIGLSTLNVGSAELRGAWREHGKTKAFFATNILGFCSDLDSVEEACRSEGVVLIEDNCESFGSVHRGRKLGNFSLASTFSLYVGHHLSTIEGGVVCTDDDDLADMLKMVRAHGWDRSLDSADQQRLRRRHNVSDFFGLYTFYDLGFNLRPTEIAGFIGVEQLQFADEIVRRREANFRRFQKAAQSGSGTIPLEVGHMDRVSNFAFPVIFREEREFRATVDRFLAGGVEVRPVVGGNMTRQPFFQKAHPGRSWNLPNAEQVHDLGFYFPNNPDLEEPELELLVRLLEDRK